MNRYVAVAFFRSGGAAVRRGVCAISLLVGLVLTYAVPAGAESLEQALSLAYSSNPDLRAQRASLRAIDEEVARARSGYRPDVTATGDLGYNKSNTTNIPALMSSPFSSGTRHPKEYAFILNQPLFQGLRTVNAVREAEANVRAGREDLRTVEQTVLLDAVTAYVNVVRDQAIVRLQENNVKVLTEQLTATKDRFEVGEVTKTDVAQSEARRAGSISELSAAQADLKSSRAFYEQVIGQPPSNLAEPPPIESVLPSSLPDALGIGLDTNPEILSALFREEASRYVIKQIVGETLPDVSVEARYAKRYEPALTARKNEETTVIGRLTVPLYSGGEPSARARAARNIQDQRRREIDSARNKIRAIIVAAWSRLVAARAQVESDQSQVRANQIALNGVQEEEKVGQRTILNVLDAEQEYLDSQVALVGTKRDLVVASFALYSAVGRLDAISLGLPVEYYDPDDHYKRVRRKLFGFGRRLPEYR